MCFMSTANEFPFRHDKVCLYCTVQYSNWAGQIKNNIVFPKEKTSQDQAAQRHCGYQMAIYLS